MSAPTLPVKEGLADGVALPPRTEAAGESYSVLETDRGVPANHSRKRPNRGGLPDSLEAIDRSEARRSLRERRMEDASAARIGRATQCAPPAALRSPLQPLQLLFLSPLLLDLLDHVGEAPHRAKDVRAPRKGPLSSVAPTSLPCAPSLLTPRSRPLRYHLKVMRSGETSSVSLWPHRPRIRVQLTLLRCEKKRRGQRDDAARRRCKWRCASCGLPRQHALAASSGSRAAPLAGTRQPKAAADVSVSGPGSFFKHTFTETASRAPGATARALKPRHVREV